MTKSVADLANRWLTRTPETLSELESRVLQSAISRQTISRDRNEDYAGAQNFGDRLADAIARIGGSWSFIVAAIALLIVWTLGNAWLLGGDSFDPYPFIFLNLVLSMIAALQAPIIMMSQNRQAERDRLDASHDYAVNLKAEIEIMALHEKLDELRHREMLELRDRIATLSASLEALDARLARGDAKA
ncbi:DUF1003 domain-containing protein [Aquamicrobium sp. LC103]|uniref:DUF1003 domain-containing protein n=1 Tax=Aquamicrobium sp. LC103 TaxID=1120658 RepID=UPI00063EC863|nr:DUF1003 domain-containing protein [Aquamicrobium sp. LC103]TKT76847.1 DUF1003 domain-containing protein [Aquamicrobium sp. LC103]